MVQLFPPLFIVSVCAVTFLQELKEHRDTQTTLETVTHVFDIKKEEGKKRVKKKKNKEVDTVCGECRGRAEGE